MIAGRLVPPSLRSEPWFRWRGGDVSRIEALTDMVFAFALTLLVVSLEVPTTFDEMAAAFRQLPAFAGLVYFAMPIAHSLHGWRSGVAIERLVRAREAREG